MLFLEFKTWDLWSPEVKEKIQEVVVLAQRGNKVNVKFGNSTADIRVMGMLLEEIEKVNKGLDKVVSVLRTYKENEDTLVRMVITRDGDL